MRVASRFNNENSQLGVFLRDPKADQDELARAVAAETRGEARTGVHVAARWSRVRRSNTTVRTVPFPPNTALRRVSTSIRSIPRWDVCTCPHPDLVSLQYPGGAKRAGMAGPADGQGAVAVPAAGELLRLDLRDYRPGAGTAGAGSWENGWAELLDALGTPARIRSTRNISPALSGQLLLNRLSVANRQPTSCSGRGELPEAADAAAGAPRMLSYSSVDVMRYLRAGG